MTEIPADWTLITAGNGRTYWTDYVEGQKYPRSWRGLDDGYRFNDAEILIMGEVRRAVVLTLPGLTTVWAEHEVREHGPGLSKINAADLYAAALYAEESHE